MYVVIDKTSLMAVALEIVKPTDDAYGNAWVVPAPDGYNIVLPTWAVDGTYIPGTTWTLEQILAYVAKYEAYLASYDEALATAIANVNGTLIGDLTSLQLKYLLLILCAEKGWIAPDRTIQIPT